MTRGYGHRSIVIRSEAKTISPSKCAAACAIHSGSEPGAGVGTGWVRTSVLTPPRGGGASGVFTARVVVDDILNTRRRKGADQVRADHGLHIDVGARAEPVEALAGHGVAGEHDRLPLVLDAIAERRRNRPVIGRGGDDPDVLALPGGAIGQFDDVARGRLGQILVVGEPVADVVAEHLDGAVHESSRAHRARDGQGIRNGRGHPPCGHQIVEIGDMVAVQVGKKDLVKLRSDEAGGGQAQCHAAPAVEQQVHLARLHQVGGPCPIRRRDRRACAQSRELHAGEVTGRGLRSRRGHRHDATTTTRRLGRLAAIAMTSPSAVAERPPPASASSAPARRRWLTSGISPSAAAALAVAILVLGWRGSDLPAQIFRADLVERYGVVLFNNLWYGGHATLDYSVISPVLASVIGPMALCAISGLLAAILFDRIVRYHFGSSWWIGSLWFAAGTATNLMIGRATFALGITLGLATVLAIQHHRFGLAIGGALLTSLASPVAGLFVAIVGTAWALSAAKRRVPGLTIAAAACAPIGVMALLFRDAGVFPYEGWALVRDLSVCALFVVAMRGPYRPMRWGAAVYAAVVIVTFLVPSPLGGNVSRLAQYVAGPLIVCALWSQRRIVIVAMVLPMVLWQWIPAMDSVAWARHDPSMDRAYYQPLINEIQRQDGLPGRVEIPFTYHHWETAYVAPEVALARGWERQLDIERNSIFYDDTLSVASYEQWLTDNAVEYVALPSAQLDASSLAEKDLLVSRLPYLEEVWRSTDWVLWRFHGYPGMIEGSATLLGMDADEFRLVVYVPGDIVVRVRPSSYWQVNGQGCASADESGWTRLEDVPTGLVVVTQDLLADGCPQS